ncbi:MAG: hypothetical protein KDK70_39880, partial [Myxococcales bacterium]|nr:hypothetical protein [Myxococcales bacterium]
GMLALAEGRPDQARPPLQQALGIIEGQDQDVDPSLAGEVRLGLAKALWPVEPARARALLDAARRDYTAGGEGTAAALRELEQWAAEHGVQAH